MALLPPARIRIALVGVVACITLGFAAAGEKTKAPNHKDTPASGRPVPAEAAPPPGSSPAMVENAPTSPVPNAPATPSHETAAAPSPDPKLVEINDAFKAGLAAATNGPASVPLIDQARLQIAALQVFIPKEQGLRLLRALGNSPSDDGMMGLVVGRADANHWIVVVRFAKEGYVKDDDAKNWNADDLLRNIKERTEEDNKERAARGFPSVEVIGWIEKPAYDASKHRLVWSLSTKSSGAPEGGVKGVNYNTLALGREGYFSLNMLTDSESVEGLKPVAKALLADLAYNSGKRYEDFNASTDQIAAYGLAALVGGVAAKKLGLIALGAAFFAKFAKIAILAVVGAAAAVTKFFKRDKKV
jgi:uncharacterized membrane-anchored protein